MFREMEINIPPLTELMASIPKEELSDEIYQRMCYSATHGKYPIYWKWHIRQRGRRFHFYPFQSPGVNSSPIFGSTICLSRKKTATISTARTPVNGNMQAVSCIKTAE